jgi:hypothetical protein
MQAAADLSDHAFERKILCTHNKLIEYIFAVLYLNSIIIQKLLKKIIRFERVGNLGKF